MMRKTERGLLILGLGLLAFYFGARIVGFVSSRMAVRRFEEHRAALESAPSRPATGTPPAERVDFSTWAAERIQAYQQSLSVRFDPALAVLRIPKVRLTVPIFEGTDDLTLNRGAGRILGTARPGQAGNLGIAGHRDGFFRSLKDIEVGDSIDLELPGSTQHYVVDQLQIVGPDDVSVLRPTAAPSLTLVTCYPFYFTGHAPQRFIVHAALQDAAPGLAQRMNPTRVPTNPPEEETRK